MFDAIGLYQLWWRKKKVEQFIIPPVYFKNSGYSITEVKSQKSKVESQTKIENPVSKVENPDNSTEKINVQKEETATAPQAQTNVAPKPEVTGEPKISAFSLASIRKKKELEANSKSYVKPTTTLPTEEFSETEMLLQWNKYAQRLGDKGYKIMESLLLINDPKLDGTMIYHELPNEGSKIDFDSEKHDLLGYLRGKLHNHDIQIEVVVNETVENKFAFTPQDKFNRMNEINPALEVLRRTFDLDI